jgi:ketosteroid isomerase-like protein
MDRAAVEDWINRYEQLWRSPGTDRLTELFAPDATYRPSPWAIPLSGLMEIASYWEAERDGPDEEFTMSSQVLAVDGDVAVVRVFVEYGSDTGAGRWRDLWVLGFAPDGRCSSFEEWPFAPVPPDGHE